MKDKLVMDCKRGRNYKKENFFDGSYSMKVKCAFMLISLPSGSGWRVTSEFHNHKLAKDLDDHDVLGHLKDNERYFVNGATKYNVVPIYIIVALKDKDPENLTSVTQMYKEIYTYKTSKRGSFIEMQYLSSLIHEEKYMY